MNLSTRLWTTAERLINTYGNTVTVKATTDDGVYNPQTGTNGNPVLINYTKKAVSKSITTSLLQNSSIPENEWGQVKTVFTMIKDVETEIIDNSYTIDDIPVMKVAETKAQDNGIVLKVYCG